MGKTPSPQCKATRHMTCHQTAQQTLTALSLAFPIENSLGGVQRWVAIVSGLGRTPFATFQEEPPTPLLHAFSCKFCLLVRGNSFAGLLDAIQYVEKCATKETSSNILTTQNVKPNQRPKGHPAERWSRCVPPSARWAFKMCYPQPTHSNWDMLRIGGSWTRHTNGLTVSLTEGQSNHPQPTPKHLIQHNHFNFLTHPRATQPLVESLTWHTHSYFWTCIQRNLFFVFWSCPPDTYLSCLTLPQGFH